MSEIKELRPHQKEALSKLDNGKILCGDVGTGKSLVAVNYYIEKETPKDVYVITTAKKRDSFDWQEEFQQFRVGSTPSPSGHGQLVVDSWNNISKYEDVQDAFFIFDEQRLVGSGAWVKAFLRIVRRNRWILLSATPGDTWLDYIPVFVANGFYKNRTQFKIEHVIYNHHAKFPKVDRYVGTGKLVRLRNQLLVEMPYERHTTRHIYKVKVDHDSDLMQKVVKERWHVYENRPLRDAAELFIVMRKVATSHTSRLTALTRILQEKSRVIVFYNFDYELEMLRSLLRKSESDRSSGKRSERSCLSGTSEQCAGTGSSSQRTLTPSTTTRSAVSLAEPSSETESFRSSDRSTSTSGARCTSSGSSSDVAPGPDGAPKDGNTSAQPTDTDYSSSLGPLSGVQIAEWNGHRHDPIPTSDRWVYLVQYTAGSEGWNCVDTDTMVFFSLTYSYRAWHQAFGRIDRLNTPFSDLHYYVLASNSWIERQIWKALTAKKNFNESAWRKKLGNNGDFGAKVTELA